METGEKRCYNFVYHTKDSFIKIELITTNQEIIKGIISLNNGVINISEFCKLFPNEEEK